LLTIGQHSTISLLFYMTHYLQRCFVCIWSTWKRQCPSYIHQSKHVPWTHITFNNIICNPYSNILTVHLVLLQMYYLFIQTPRLSENIYLFLFRSMYVVLFLSI